MLSNIIYYKIKLLLVEGDKLDDYKDNKVMVVKL